MASGPTPAQTEAECRMFSLAILQVGSGSALAAGPIAARSDNGRKPRRVLKVSTNPRPLQEDYQLSKPTPEELEQLRAGTLQPALEGKDVSGLAAVYDLVTGETPGPGDDD